MKYVVLILDGAAGLPLVERGSRTCLEIARTPNLDSLAREGALGLARTVPAGMEPSSACACMSVLGYDPELYYRGRAAIEARSMGIGIGENEVVFRCNLVAIRDGRMFSYSSGHISSPEAHQLVSALNQSVSGADVHFYPGVSYRHLCKLVGHGDTILATCTPPHDIPGRPVADYLPHGPGSQLLRDLMARSEAVLGRHPVNLARQARGDVPASGIWLFWGCGRVPEMPTFFRQYGLSAAMTSGVDLLRGLADMAGIDILRIEGVTDSLSNDYAGQAEGALRALDDHELVIVHVEAADEAGHAGSIEEKVEAIERADAMLGLLRAGAKATLRILVIPDHPTPIRLQTHTDAPVPFLLWGPGIPPNGARRFNEREAGQTGFLVEKAYNIMNKLVRGL